MAKQRLIDGLEPIIKAALAEGLTSEDILTTVAAILKNKNETNPL